MTVQDSIWSEKYRPQTVEQCILPVRIKKQFEDIITTGDVPNMLLSGSAGTGKTSLSKALCKEMDLDWLFLNMSEETGIDVLRTKIRDFASTLSLTESSNKRKVVILDECLADTEKVRIGKVDEWKAVALKDLEWGVVYPVVSFNMESKQFENDVGELISEKDDNLYRVTLSNGESITCNMKHPFVCMDKNTFTTYERTIEQGLNGHAVVVDGNGQNGISTTAIVYGVTTVSRGKVRNLTVYGNHTFVTENGIVTHNCDHASPNFQAGLRAFLESFSKTCSFILTCNFPNRIIDPLHSRTVPVDFTINKDESMKMQAQMFKRVGEILDKESIPYDKRVVGKLVQKLYPDNRRIMNHIQQYAKAGEIDEGVLLDIEEMSIENLVKAMQTKKFKDVRQWCAENTKNDLSNLYTKLYQEMDHFVEPKSKPEVILTIAEYQKHDGVVPDKEIHIVAMCVELMMQAEFKE